MHCSLECEPPLCLCTVVVIYIDRASRIFNTVNDVPMFKSSDNENENDNNTNQCCQKTDIMIFFFFFFFFRAELSALWRFPGQGSNWSCSHQPMPQPQQFGIWATSATYTTAPSNAGSLTHWARPGIEPASSWILVSFVSTAPQQEFLLWVSLIGTRVIRVRARLGNPGWSLYLRILN